MADPSDPDPGGAAKPPDHTFPERFRIERALGRGGMGEVVLARDTLLNRRVALKRLRSDGGDRATNRAAILKEARRASQVNDRRIAAIYDVLDLEDEIVIVMEYVDGVTLRQRMTAPVPLEEFWNVALQCVEAIGAAHAQGVIHRDIKPENLMLTGDGQIKILDFGIARRSRPADGTTLTRSQISSIEIAGTPQYMAPEAHLGGAIDERTDIFSLGAVFYELLTAKQPFEGTTYAAVVDKVLNATPPPVTEVNPGAGPALSGVVAKMLEKDPTQRFDSPADLMRQLTWARRESGRPSSVGGEGAAREPAGVARESGGDAVAAPRHVRASRAWVVPSLALVGLAVATIAVIRWGGGLGMPRDRNVAILAPATPGASEDFASFALGATDLLYTRLRRHAGTPGFQLASLQEVLDEKVGSAGDARKVLGATLALIPTLEQGPDLMRARLDLYDTARERLIASRTVELPASQPFEFLDRTARAAAALLRVPERDSAGPPALGVRGAGTLRFYLQGLGRLRSATTETAARRAADDLELACRTEPDAAVAWAALSAAQLRLHVLAADSVWLERAEASAREAVALDGNRAETHRALGSVLGSLKQRRESAIELVRALDLDPNNDDTRFTLARTYARLSEPEKERDVYLEAIRRRPNDWRPRWWLATWHFREGHVDEAARAYEEMIHRAPLFYKGYSSLGGVLIQRGDYVRAIEALQRSVALRPNRIAYDNLGTAYFNTNRFTEAIDAYNQSFQFGDADYVSWVNLGDAYFWLRGRKDEAAQAYAQAVRLGRDEILERAREGRTPDVTIPANLATVFPKLGQPDSARVYLGRALSADSTNTAVTYCAALTCWQLNEKGRAMSWIEKSVRAGYPTVWLRDSPIFDEWREVPAFRALVGGTKPEPQQAASHR